MYKHRYRIFQAPWRQNLSLWKQSVLSDWGTGQHGAGLESGGHSCGCGAQPSSRCGMWEQRQCGQGARYVGGSLKSLCLSPLLASSFLKGAVK